MKRILATIAFAGLIAVLFKLNGFWPNAGEASERFAETPSIAVVPHTSARLEPRNVPGAVFVEKSKPSAAQAPVTFMGEDCTGDCSVLLAGYHWAEANAVSDDDTCPGNSDFTKGCRLFARDERELNR